MKLMRKLLGEDMNTAQRRLQHWYAAYGLGMFVFALFKMTIGDWESAGYILLIVMLVMNLMSNNYWMQKFRAAITDGEAIHARLVAHIDYLHAYLSAIREGRALEEPEGPQ